MLNSMGDTRIAQDWINVNLWKKKQETNIWYFGDQKCHAWNLQNRGRIQKIKKSKNRKPSKLLKSKGFDRNGGRHAPYLEKSRKMHWVLLIFEPWRPISWTFLYFWNFGWVKYCVRWVFGVESMGFFGELRQHVESVAFCKKIGTRKESQKKR